MSLNGTFPHQVQRLDPDGYKNQISLPCWSRSLNPEVNMVSCLFLVVLGVCGLVGAQQEGLEARVEKLEQKIDELGECVWVFWSEFLSDDCF